ncbi:ATP-binding protein [Enterococcus timonensis]|uniref:ATP-binding protein n=1 Tax=Enterococcus timonensis TaxID=1852364 RepID=UPI0008D9E302|nr:ATP-binding protein [Enterococcus timonensis]
MEAVTHKCPNCGGGLTFEPADQKFHCPFCLSIFTEAEVLDFEKKQAAAHVGATVPIENPAETLTDVDQTAADKTTDAEAESTENATDLEMYLCPNCGAEIVTEPTTAATYCYFCHNPVVLSGRLSGTFQPEKVLPFAITKEQAVEKFLAWTKKKYFIPKNFFDEKQIQLLTGVYFPYWDVEADLKGQFQGKGTTLRIWRMGDIEYTETKQFAINRRGNLKFSQMIKNALSKNTQKKMVTSILPFQLEKAVNFHSQYLAGFQAEKRDIEINELNKEINDDLKRYATSMLKASVNQYNTVTGEKTSIEVTDQKNHYVLLPVWLLTYRNPGDETVYYFALNGQTGKTAGILPISQKKLALVSGGIFAAVFLLALLGGFFLL